MFQKYQIMQDRVTRVAPYQYPAANLILDIRDPEGVEVMRVTRKVFVLTLAVLAVASFVDAGWFKRAIQFPIDAMTPLPAGLGVLPAPPLDDPKNPATPRKIELGRQLFHDTRLSGDESMSCASCHPPETGYAEAVPFSAGAEGKPMPRHTPTVLNAGYAEFMSWDGKFANTSQLVLAVLGNPKNMNMQDEGTLIARLESVPEYRASFQEVFGGGPTKLRVAEALDAYVRGLTTPNSPFDRYAAGNKKALTDAQKRGLTLFVGKANCAVCHFGPTFADDRFHSLGVQGDDPGRFKVTNVESDRYAFKTPTIRNIALTAPYMHDGSLPTLHDVIDFYNAGGGAQTPKSRLLRRLHLTPQEKTDLIAFLESLTGDIEKRETPLVAGGR
jgi:cytochrome c peroxidase